MVKEYIFVLLTLLFVLSGCEEKPSDVIELKDKNETSKSTSPETYSTDNNKKNDIDRNVTGIYELNDFFGDSKELAKQTEEILARLNDSQKVGQMIVTAVGVYGKPESVVAELISKNRIGGVLLLKGSKAEFEKYVNNFKKRAAESNSLPLIFSADAEPSLINIKISGIKKFEPTNAAKNVRESAVQITEILKKIGVNQNYAPVCDLSYNTEIIGNRSYGSNTDNVVKLAGEFISETQKANIIATAKHFPGHGNVKGDSHKDLVFINGDMKELKVFEEIIKKNVISVMVGHIAIRNNSKYDTKGFPSTLSKTIVTDLLKNELGFRGLVVTDAMNMNGVNKFQSPSLNAIKAGCDMVIMPSDEVKLINSVVSDMQHNEAFKTQIYDSVRKIIRAKICLGLFN